MTSLVQEEETCEEERRREAQLISSAASFPQTALKHLTGTPSRDPVYDIQLIPGGGGMSLDLDQKYNMHLKLKVSSC